MQRRAFKKNAGQNNHFLITILVGLDSVKSGTAMLSPEFSTSWSPRDRNQSYKRSRQYALDTSLVWILDLVGNYRKSLARTPGLLDEAQVAAINNIDGGAARFRAFSELLSLSESDDELLLQLAYLWRNVVVHSEKRPKVPSVLRVALQQRRDAIATEYRGLNVLETMNRIEQRHAPTFKEVASIIAAAHAAVARLDEQAITYVGQDALAERSLSDFFESRVNEGHGDVFSRFWPGSPEKTRARLTQLLLQRGWSAMNANDPQLSETFVDEVVHLSPSAARARYLRAQLSD